MSETTENKKRKSILSRIARRLILLPIVAVVGLFFLSLTAPAPEGLGASSGQLAKCPETPNCVSTQAGDESKKMEPIPFESEPADMLAKIKSTIASDFSRAKLITESDNYLHFEFRSMLFRFVDDVEFLVDDNNSTIQFRSASRVGHSDLGANRKRMTKIREGLIQ